MARFHTLERNGTVIGLLSRTGSVDLVTIYRTIMTQLGNHTVLLVGNAIGQLVRQEIATVDTCRVAPNGSHACCLKLKN